MLLKYDIFLQIGKTFSRRQVPKFPLEGLSLAGLGQIGSAVLTFIRYKQTYKLTDK